METTKNVFAFERTTSNALKGVFLLLMFVLHFFCFPSYYVDGISLPQTLFMEKMQGNFQICVAGFAFLTGFLYNYAKKKDFKYTVKKWLDLLIPYWFVYALLLIVALVFGVYEFNIKEFLLELFALKRPIMRFCWYVTFYLLSVLVLQILCNTTKNKTIFILGIGIFGPIAVYMLLQRITGNQILLEIAEKFQVFFPISVVGYATSKWKIYEKLNEIKLNKYLKALIGLFFVVFVFSQPSWMYSFGDFILIKMATKIIRIFSIPFFVYGLILLFDVTPKWIKKPFELIGKNSMLMWFIHCIFFNCCAEIFQPILYLPHFPIIVLLWGIILNLFIAIPLNSITNKIRKVVKI